MGGHPVVAEVGVGARRDWLPGFTEEVHALAVNSDRPISAGWAQYVAQNRLHNPGFLDLLDRFHHVNNGATPGEALRRSLSSVQSAILDAQSEGELPNYLPEYPCEKYTEPETWALVYGWLRKTTSGYGNRYYRNFLERPLTTSVSQRTVAAQFLSRVLSHHMDAEPLMADCGCSDMAGDRRLWLSTRDEQFAYDPVQIVSRAAGNLVVSDYKSDIFQNIVSGRNNIRRLVGLDQNDPTLPRNIAWSNACPTPEEIWSGSWQELHDRLMRAEVPGSWLDFQMANFANRNDMRRIVDREGVFDAAMMIFSWYQGSAEVRRRKIINARNVLVRPSGLLIIADFARIVAESYLSPLDQWKEPTVFVGHEGKLDPVLRPSNGRFTRMQVLPQLAELARGGEFENEVNELLA